MPPLQRVYSLLLAHENRLERRLVINQDGSLHSLNLLTKIVTIFLGFSNMNRRGQVSIGQFNRRTWNSNQKPQYQLCGHFGHTVNRCYYRFDSIKNLIFHLLLVQISRVKLLKLPIFRIVLRMPIHSSILPLFLNMTWTWKISGIRILVHPIMLQMTYPIYPLEWNIKERTRF